MSRTLKRLAQEKARIQLRLFAFTAVDHWYSLDLLLLSSCYWWYIGYILFKTKILYFHYFHHPFLGAHYFWKHPNGVKDALKNPNWTLEEIRSGGAHGIDGKVDKRGSLLATINKNVATLVELQPEVSAGVATEIRSIMETTGDKVASFLKRIPRPKHLHFEASYPLPIWRQCQN